MREPDPPAFIAANDSDQIVPAHPRRLVGILRRRARLIGLIGLAGLGFSAALAYGAAVRYRSTAVIRVRDPRAAIGGGIGGRGGFPATATLGDPLRSLIAVLTSRSVAAAVVDSAPLLRFRTDGMAVSTFRDPRIESRTLQDTIFLEFWEAGTRLAGAPPQQTVPYGEILTAPGLAVTVSQRPSGFSGVLQVVSAEAAITELLRGLELRSRPYTDVIDVSFTSSDPVLVREVANRLVTTFRQVDADTAQQVSRARLAFLRTQLGQTEVDLGKTRAELTAFRSSGRAVIPRDRLSTDQVAVGVLQGRRAELDGERRLYRALLARLEAPGETSDGIEALLSSGGLAANPVINQISGQLARFEEELESLTGHPSSGASPHPDVERLENLVAGAHSRLSAAVRSLISVLDARMAALDATLSSVRDARGAAPDRARNGGELAARRLAGREAREAQLAEDVEAARRLVEQMRAEYQQARLDEAVALGEVEIVDYAGPALRLGRSPYLIMGLGLALGIVAGCIAALVTEYLMPSIRRQEELAAALGAPGTIVIPRAVVTLAVDGTRLEEGGRGLVTLSDWTSGAAEAYRALRTTLLFSPEAAGLKSVLVTSALAGEGKSTVAANLAVVFAQQGVRVLLIDCDLRRARQHRIFQVKRSPGLTALLAGSIRPAAAIRTTLVRNLSLLPAGPPPTNPAELLGGADMAGTLAFLAGEFDLVICDSPPLLVAADASILATRIEAVLMVVRAGRVEEEVVQRARQQLTTVGARVIAAVLNDPDSEVKRYGGDYSFSGYGSDTGESADS